MACNCDIFTVLFLLTEKIEIPSNEYRLNSKNRLTIRVKEFPHSNLRNFLNQVKVYLALYPSPSIIKNDQVTEDEIDRACSTNGGEFI
jgi:hypothetical protein